MQNRQRKYWWVNHKKTVKQEIGGEFLWSPLKEKGGKRSQFYDNMRQTRPGDMVISYADTRVSYIGKVMDYCLPFSKPATFGDVWASSGWLVPVQWLAVPIPIRVKDHIVEVAPLLPAKYSPIQAATGNGNQKAYLTHVSQDLYERVLDLTGVHIGEETYANTPINRSSYYEDLYSGVANQDASSLSDTEAEVLAKQRRGQRIFRRKVFSTEKKCRFTGLSDPAFLIASHIRPWRLCEHADERLDGDNGLLLPPNIDLLFDRGLLTILPNGQVKIADDLDMDTRVALNVTDYDGIDVGPFSNAQQDYLSFHNSRIFVAPEP